MDTSTGATSPMNYVMGRYPDGLKYPGSEIPKTVARVVEVDSASAIPGVSSAGGKKYLSIKYVGGTTCDLTGRPRATEVQYHCSQSKEYISAIQETSICNYLAIVHTPRLCHPPFFNQAEFNLQKPHDIVCSQIVSDEFYELSQSASNADSRGNANSNANGIRRGSDRATVQDEILHGSSATTGAAAGSDDSGIKIKGIRVLPIKLPNQGVIDINELWSDIANVVAEELSGEDQVEEQEERAAKLNTKKKKKKPKDEL
ncbi:hypothetical protein BKA69DRAFT_1057084 [Paraphysoderma sedebokerense]|nr:hypothetical protein BKA69DRAFT_1057084 [Paraphysoderma sedebokerense]